MSQIGTGNIGSNAKGSVKPRMGEADKARNVWEEPRKQMGMRAEREAWGKLCRALKTSLGRFTCNS